MDANGGNVTQLTDNSREDGALNWTCSLANSAQALNCSNRII